MLKKLYIVGSLKQENGEFSFELENNLYPGTVIAIEPIIVNDVEFTTDRIKIYFDDGSVLASNVSDNSPFKLEKGKKFTFKIKGNVSSGSNTILFSFNTKEAGKITFDVEDSL